MDLKIRPAQTGDLIYLVNSQIAMAKETENKELSQTTLIKGVRHLLNSPKIGEYLIASIGSKNIGCVLTLNEWSDWRNGNVIWIHSLYVDPSYRKNGVFRSFYNYLKKKVEDDSSIKGLRLYVDKTNESAQKAYEKMGMDGDHYKVYEWLPED